MIEDLKGKFDKLTYPNRQRFFGAQTDSSMREFPRTKVLELVRAVPLTDWKFNDRNFGNIGFRLESAISGPYFIVGIDPLRLEITTITLCPSDSCVASKLNFTGEEVNRMYYAIVEQLKKSGS